MVKNLTWLGAALTLMSMVGGVWAAVHLVNLGIAADEGAEVTSDMSRTAWLALYAPVVTFVAGVVIIIVGGTQRPRAAD